MGTTFPALIVKNKYLAASARPSHAHALERLAEEEGLLPIFVHDRQLVDVANARVAAVRQATMPFDRLEYRPGLLAAESATPRTLDAPIALVAREPIREEDALDRLRPQDVAPIKRMRVRQSTLVDAPVPVVFGLLTWQRKEDDLGAEARLRARVRVDAGVEQRDASLPVSSVWPRRAVHEQAGEEADEMILLRHWMPRPATSVLN